VYLVADTSSFAKSVTTEYFHLANANILLLQNTELQSQRLVITDADSHTIVSQQCRFYKLKLTISIARRMRQKLIVFLQLSGCSRQASLS
jgi:hypothetical protein